MIEETKKITEIEIKAYVTDIELIRRNLLNLGAKDLGNFEYDDVYFVPSDESKKRKFLKNEEEKRIRKIKKDGKFSKLIETYKKPVNASYLFSWDNVPGNDSEKFLRFLKDNLNIGWAENAEISKSNGGKTISVFKDEYFAKIKIDEKEEKATLNINNVKVRNLEVKKGNGKLSIYSSNKKTKREWETTDYKPTDFAILAKKIFERGCVQYVNVKKTGSNFSIEYKYKENEAMSETHHLDLTVSKVDHCGCFLEIECPISGEAASFERQKAYDVIYAFLFEVGGLKKTSIELKYYTELVSEYVQRVKSDDDYSYLCDSLLERLIAASERYFSLKSKKYLYNYLLETGYLKVKVLKDAHSKKLVQKCYLYENWYDTLKHTRAIKFIKYIKEEFQNIY